MNSLAGKVSDEGWPMVRVRVSHPTSGESLDVDAMIDTGCTNGLVLQWDQVLALGLPKTGSTRTQLADGSRTSFANYSSIVEWFGRPVEVRTFGTAGNYPLIGLRLLEDLLLTIDYPARKVLLMVSPSA